MKYLLIDGYNVIAAWQDIFAPSNSLEDNRDKLQNMISNYQGFTELEIYVVFDGHMIKGNNGTFTKYDRLSIVFTKEGETADNYIERFVYTNRTENISVVSSDGLIQTTIMGVGAIRVTPKEFRKMLEQETKEPAKRYNSYIKSRNQIESILGEELYKKLDKMRKGK